MDTFRQPKRIISLINFKLFHCLNNPKDFGIHPGMGEQETKANHKFSAPCPGPVRQHKNLTWRVKPQQRRSSKRVGAGGEQEARLAWC